jgi:hypothetical protein
MKNGSAEFVNNFHCRCGRRKKLESETELLTENYRETD